MRRHWNAGILRLLIAGGVILGIAWPLGIARLTLEILLVGYLVWSVYQLIRLHQWLRDGSGDPPESRGLWGDIFDGIHDLQRKQKKSRKRLRKVLSRVQQSLSSLRDGVVMVDGDNDTLEWWNGSAERLLGFRKTTDRDQPLLNLLRDPMFIHYYREEQYNEPLQIFSPLRPDCTLQIEVNEFGKKDKLIMVRDITRVQQLEQVRRDFVANVSHELKTPLTVIRGYLETLLDTSVSLPPATRKALQEMDGQSQRMSNLIRDLLYLSRLENEGHAEHCSTLSAGELLQGVISDIRPLAEKRSVEVSLTLDVDPCLLGNEKELYSAFSNLAINAVKYSREGGHLWIRCQQGIAGGIDLSFSDDGEGIDEQHLQRLTERFYRVDKGRSVASGGTGLGLAIVKHVLMRHEGRLEIRSELGAGSQFTCHFPDHRVVSDAA